MFVRVREPENQEELERLWAFRYRVYLGDLRRGTYNLDHDRKWLNDKLDATAHHLIAVDNDDNIVGCLRSNYRQDTDFPEYLEDWLRVSALDQAVGDLGYGYTSLLMVEPSMRGRTVASLLALRMYHDGTRAGRVKLDICCCELNLVHVYYQLGYRPYAPPFRVEGAGMRVPLVLCGHDRDYLERVGSPLVNIFPREGDDRGISAQRLRSTFGLFNEPAFEPLPDRLAWAILAAGPGPEGRDDVDRVTIFQGLSGEQLGQVLGTVTRVWFSPGDRIYERGETELSSGVIVSGRVGIHLAPGPDPHFLQVLGPGDVFGEVSGLGNGVRSAYLTALDRVEAMLLPPDFVDRVGRKNKETAFCISRNLNTVLANRLTTANDLLAGIFSGEAVEEVSYDIRSDSGEELARLEEQATVMLQQELGILSRLGLRPGQRVLDVGCGAGILTAAIAERVADTHVTGLDFNSLLLDRANGRLPEALRPRCRFLRGDGAAIPLAADSQDFAFARFVLQHLKRPSAVVAEMARVVRPGGTVCVVDVDDGGIILHPEPEGFYDVQQQIEKVKGRQGANRKVGRRLGAIFTNAGFADVAIQVLPVTSREMGAKTLLHLAFAFRKRLLQESGAYSRDAARFFEDLERLPATPGSLVVVPIFLATGIKSSA